MNSFIFKTDIIRSERGYKCSLKANPEDFKDLFFTGELLSLSVSISFSISDHSILAEGEVKASIKGECCRCLKKIQIDLFESFEQVYEDPGDEIDVKPVLMETVAMMEPQKIVCPVKCDETLLNKYAPSNQGDKWTFSALKKVDFKKKEK